MNNIDEIKKWVAALRSGEYKQTKKTLQDEFGYCCLGVACHVLYPEKLVCQNGYILGAMPENQLYIPIWLKTIDYDFKTKTGVRLSELNDSGKYTFNNIANFIERVYINGENIKFVKALKGIYEIK